MNNKLTRVGVVGCGGISDIYLTNMINRFDGLEVVSCCSLDMEETTKKAEKYGIQASTLDDILMDDSIDIVLNLTPPSAHYGILKKALLAGKNVYTEKALTGNYEQAKELLAIAKEKKLYICSSPDTFLGAGLQTANRAIRDGIIGEVTSCHLSVNRDLNMLREFMPAASDPGAGIYRDLMCYSMTGALGLFGPVKRICGFWDTSRPNRISSRGDSYTIESENRVTAAMQLESGVQITVNANGDSIWPEIPEFVIYGTKGILYLGDTNTFNGKVMMQKGVAGIREISSTKVELVEIPFVNDFSDDSRGIGVAEMAAAMKAGRTPLTDASLAAHLVECADALVQSCETDKTITLESTFEPIGLFTPDMLS